MRSSVALAEAPQFADSALAELLPIPKSVYDSQTQAESSFHHGVSTGEQAVAFSGLASQTPKKQARLELAPESMAERRKSFDMLASVDMFRYDLKHFKEIKAETRQRVCDEELSYIVEGMNRAARTSFTLKRADGELQYYNEGKFQPYSGMLITGLEVAKDEAKRDPRREFLADWATENLAQGYAMNSLKPGQRRSWQSSYAHKEAALYGEQFINSTGLVSKRKLGFLYSAICLEDGSVRLETQTVDRSDPNAFAAVETLLAENPEADLDEQLLVHDAVLSTKHNGQKFRAGRTDSEIEQNVWETMLEQRDLIAYHLDGIEKLALAADTMIRSELERATKLHFIGVWKEFKNCLDGRSGCRNDTTNLLKNSRAYQSSPNGQQAYRQPSVAERVQLAVLDFFKDGEEIIGCGAKINTDDLQQSIKSIMAAGSRMIFESIFGGADALKELEAKVGEVSIDNCIVQSCPNSKKKVFVGGCGVCLQRCQPVFDRGGDPTKQPPPAKPKKPETHEFSLMA